jgi:hypothetical protein
MKIVLSITGIFVIPVFLLILSITHHTAHTVLVEYDCRKLDSDVPDKIVEQCNNKNKGNK